MVNQIRINCSTPMLRQCTMPSKSNILYLSHTFQSLKNKEKQVNVRCKLKSMYTILYVILRRPFPQEHPQQCFKTKDSKVRYADICLISKCVFQHTNL